MATSTTSTSTVSFSLTPQAKDDVFSLTEQGLTDGLYSGATLSADGSVVTLNVMANDLGGAAKTMYSVDDTTSSLLTKDADTTSTADYTTTWESTVNGNQMRIVNGVVEFRFMELQGETAVVKNIRSLDTNETLTDTFMYAIRLANGTLSWASVTVTISGQDTDATGSVGYSGVAAEGGSLSADLSATDADGSFSIGYQWQVKLTDGTWQNIPDATFQTLHIPSDQSMVGQHVRVVAVTTDQWGGTTEFTGAERTIENANDAPTTAAVTLAAIAEDSDACLITQAQLLANASDVEGDTLVASDLAISAGSGALLDNGDGTWRYTPAPDDDSAVSFSYTITDNGSTNGAPDPKSVAGSASLELTAVNDAPVVAAALSAQSSDEDQAWTYTVPAGTFSDVDGHVLTLSVTLGNGDALPSWLSFDAATRTFSGTPPQDFNGQLTLKVTASDGALSASSSFDLTINPVNDAPVVAAALSAQSSDEDQAWTYTVPAGTFSDVDGDVLTLSATLGNGDALPSWLSFDAATRTFSGTPPQDFNGQLTLKVTASDGALSASSSFDLTINPVNDAPTATNLNAAESYTEDTPQNLTNIVVADVDSSSVTATLVLSTTAAGALSTGTFGTVTSTFNAGTGTWSASGSVADVNAALAAVTFNPALNFNGSFTVATSISDGVAPAVTGNKSFTGTAVNDAPAFTSSATLGTLHEHLINSTLDGFDSKNVAIVSATDVEGSTLNYSLLSDSSGGAFKIDASSGQISVRDVSLLDFESSLLSTDAEGKYFTLVVRASDGAATTDQTAKVYITNVINTTTNANVNFVDGDSNGNSLSLNNGNDVAFGDGGNDTLTGQGDNDWLFGGAGNDSLTGGNGNDLLYGGAGVDALTGANGADTFVFGDGWNSGVDTIADFNHAEADTLLLVNDQQGLFTGLQAGALSASQFLSGAGATSAATADQRVVYDTNTGNLYFDSDGAGGTAAVLFATFSKVGGAIPALAASDIVAGPLPGP